MANMTVRSTFENLLPYLPGDVRGLAEGLFRNLPRDVQLSDSLALYSAAAVHTIVAVTTGLARPLLLLTKSNGTACVVKVYQADDATVGTTDAVLSVAVSATANDMSGALLLGDGQRTLGAAGSGLGIAAPATDVGTGAVANDPNVWLIYANA
jgi:hypothetical protein